MKYIPYSYSKIATYKHCPYRFKLQYIDKVEIPFETNIALEKGKYIHSLIEYFIKEKELEGFNFSLSTEDDIKNYNKIFTDLKLNPLFQALINKDGKIFVEEGFGIQIKDKEFIATNYTKDSVVRGYIDFIKIKDNKAIIVDWKTGKYKEEQDKLQTLIYALWTFLKFPQVNEISTIFYFVEHNKYITYKYNRNQLNELKKEFLQNIVKIEKENNFNKNISKLCEWCPMKKFGYCNADVDEKELNIFKWNPKG